MAQITLDGSPAPELCPGCGEPVGPYGCSRCPQGASERLFMPVQVLAGQTCLDTDQTEER